MANRHASTIKRNRQNPKRREANRAVLTRLKTIHKKLNAALINDKKDDVQQLFTKTVSVFDRAATKGVIHHKKASRQISRLTLKVNKVLSTQKSA